MNEHPIIMTGESVRAILDDRKTQTRRIVSLRQLPCSYEAVDYGAENGEIVWELGKQPKHYNSGEFAFFDPPFSVDTYPWYVKCPYGKVGDRLWVRETWQGFNKLSGSIISNGIPKVNYGRGFWAAYKADNIADPKCKWRPSIHMPKWAARIWLEITDIRVERVQDISEADAESEGIICPEWYSGEFKILWDSINKNRGYGWETNCWVWVVEFKRIK